jgi:hypothetical protein
MTAVPRSGHAQNTAGQVPIHNPAIDLADMNSGSTSLARAVVKTALYERLTTEDV